MHRTSQSSVQPLKLAPSISSLCLRPCRPRVAPFGGSSAHYRGAAPVPLLREGHAVVSIRVASAAALSDLPTQRQSSASQQHPAVLDAAAILSRCRVALACLLGVGLWSCLAAAVTDTSLLASLTLAASKPGGRG